MKQEEFIMAIDQGTTSSRAVLIDRKGKVRASSQKEIGQIFPHSGWVEQDAHEIWLSVQSVMAGAFIEGGIQPKQVKGIGITNQRETTVIWDRKTGQPIYHAIVWQSRQSNDICEILKAQDHEKMIQSKTGLPIDPYFSASKIRWLLDHIPGAQERAERGELAFGTIDSWLIWKLSGGKLHITDYSNASRTMLYNIVDLTWEHEILELLNIPDCLLPQVVSNSEIYGYTTDDHFFGHRIPIAGIAGDQQAALVGQLAFNKGQVKSTYGTGAFILMNLGQECQLSEQALTTSIAYKLPGQAVTYCLEGSIFVAGSAVQWLRDGLGMLLDSAESQVLARQSGNHNEVYLVPAFTGLGAPYWDPDARGAIFGLTRATNRADFAKATLQSIAYQVRDIIEWMETETGVPISSLKVDGGAAQNEYLMQFQADILGKKVSRQANLETTALGVAYLAGLAVGYWESVEEIQALIEETQDFQPQMNQGQKEQLYQGWKRAVKATQVFSQELD